MCREKRCAAANPRAVLEGAACALGLCLPHGFTLPSEPCLRYEAIPHISLAYSPSCCWQKTKIFVQLAQRDEEWQSWTCDWCLSISFVVTGHSKTGWVQLQWKYQNARFQALKIFPWDKNVLSLKKLHICIPVFTWWAFHLKKKKPEKMTCWRTVTNQHYQT